LAVLADSTPDEVETGLEVSGSSYSPKVIPLKFPSEARIQFFGRRDADSLKACAIGIDFAAKYRGISFELCLPSPVTDHGYGVAIGQGVFFRAKILFRVKVEFPAGWNNWRI
jgi:hypothetical protein